MMWLGTSSMARAKGMNLSSVSNQERLSTARLALEEAMYCRVNTVMGRAFWCKATTGLWCLLLGHFWERQFAFMMVVGLLCISRLFLVLYKVNTVLRQAVLCWASARNYCGKWPYHKERLSAIGLVLVEPVHCMVSTQSDYCRDCTKRLSKSKLAPGEAEKCRLSYGVLFSTISVSGVVKGDASAKGE